MAYSVIIALVTSAAVIALVVKTGVDRLVAWLKTDTGLKWKPYVGYVMVAVKAAETAIPDGTENKSLAKLDYATKSIVARYEEATGEKVTSVDVAQIKSLVEEVLQSLKDSGALKGAS